MKRQVETGFKTNLIQENKENMKRERKQGTERKIETEFLLLAVSRMTKSNRRYRMALMLLVLLVTQ